MVRLIKALDYAPLSGKRTEHFYSGALNVENDVTEDTENDTWIGILISERGYRILSDEPSPEDTGSTQNPDEDERGPSTPSDEEVAAIINGSTPPSRPASRSRSKATERK